MVTLAGLIWYRLRLRLDAIGKNDPDKNGMGSFEKVLNSDGV